jgi:catechol 2,3-dioxygenase-like lactoylglutathione lyase family enzyme
MLNALTHTQLWVLDQDEALEFYVGKLGLEVATDMSMGTMRWVTVKVPGSAGPEIVLNVPGPPMDAEVAERVRAMIGTGALGMVILSTEDARGAFGKLSAAGVTVLQEPVEQFYGTDFAVADPFGNHIRITQPVEH